MYVFFRCAFAVQHPLYQNELAVLMHDCTLFLAFSGMHGFQKDRYYVIKHNLARREEHSSRERNVLSLSCHICQGTSSSEHSPLNIIHWYWKWIRHKINNTIRFKNSILQRSLLYHSIFSILLFCWAAFFQFFFFEYRAMHRSRTKYIFFIAHNNDE